MMRRAATAAAVLLLAIMLAAGSAWWLVLHTGGKTISVGAWKLNALAGSAEADMYSRARVAVTALFALSATETIYYQAARDGAGNPLRAACTYAITGHPLPARWWSLTAYGDDYFLIANSENRFSFNMSNLALAADGGFTVLAAPTRRPGNWLPTGAGEGVRLLLRLYNPAPSLAADPASASLPTITQVGACR